MSNDTFNLTEPRRNLLAAVKQGGITYKILSGFFYDGDQRLSGSEGRTLRSLLAANMIEKTDIVNRVPLCRNLIITPAGQALLDSVPAPDGDA